MNKPPRALRNDRQHQCLIVDWPDGKQQIITAAQLRGACRCAVCHAQQIKGQISLIAVDIQIEKINNLGSGVQFIFSDGHQRGFFPWEYLFRLG